MNKRKSAQNICFHKYMFISHILLLTCLFLFSSEITFLSSRSLFSSNFNSCSLIVSLLAFGIKIGFILSSSSSSSSSVSVSYSDSLWYFVSIFDVDSYVNVYICVCSYVSVFYWLCACMHVCMYGVWLNMCVPYVHLHIYVYVRT